MTTRVLITGVAGFLGSNLLDRMMAAGDFEIVGIDNLSMGCLDNIIQHMDSPRFRFLQRDITHEGAFDDVEHGLDCIVHLAALKIPRYGKAIDTLHVNYMGSDNVLKLARDHGCKCVLASTSDVYGRSTDLPFSESTTDCVIGSSKSPRWAYAVSKLFDEHLALAYQDTYGYPVTLLRFFGSYGPKMHLSWWGGPPPVFIDCVLNDKEIPIHGDGSQTRSFTFVDDTVDGIFAAVVKPQANGEIFNIGTTEEVTILELAQTIKRLSNTPGELNVKFIPYDEINPGKKYEDVMRRIPDTTFSQQVLGVKATTSLEEGMVQTIEWQRRAMQLVAKN